MEFFVIVFKNTIFNLLSDLNISITEWFSIFNFFVDFFYAEDVFIFFIIQNIIFHFDVRKRVNQDFQTFFQRIDGGKKDFFRQLQISMITRRQIIGQQNQFIWQSLNSVASRSHQLKNIWIFLVWHNTASRCKFFRKADEIKILTQIKTNIIRKLA